MESLEFTDPRLGKRVRYKNGKWGTLRGIERFEETGIEYWTARMDNGVTVEGRSDGFVLDEQSQKKPAR